MDKLREVSVTAVVKENKLKFEPFGEIVDFVFEHYIDSLSSNRDDFSHGKMNN